MFYVFTEHTAYEFISKEDAANFAAINHTTVYEK